MISVYPLAFDRADARVNAMDIKEACRRYQAAKGYSPAQLHLNAKMIKRLDGSLPADMEVIEKGGVMSWEVWLSGKKVEEKLGDGKIAPPAPLEIPPGAVQSKSGRAKAPNHHQSTPRIMRQPLKERDNSPKIEKSGDSKKEGVSKFIKRGRPLKIGSDVSRATLYRRRAKNLQGALI